MSASHAGLSLFMDAKKLIRARFKEIIKVVKDTSASTKESLQTLCKI